MFLEREYTQGLFLGCMTLDASYDHQEDLGLSVQVEIYDWFLEFLQVCQFLGLHGMPSSLEQNYQQK